MSSSSAEHTENTNRVGVAVGAGGWLITGGLVDGLADGAPLGSCVTGVVAGASVGAVVVTEPVAGAVVGEAVQAPVKTAETLSNLCMGVRAATSLCESTTQKERGETRKGGHGWGHAWRDLSPSDVAAVHGKIPGCTFKIQVHPFVV